MLDNTIRFLLNPVLNRCARALADIGATPNAVTWAGFGIGIAAAFAIANHHYLAGLALLLLSRLADGLDGALAQEIDRRSGTGTTDLGGFLDIVLDFVFYGAIPLAFILADPQTNAVAGSILLFAFYANGASFLTYALMAEKRGIDEAERGSKSLLYTIGLAEATETIVCFALFCLFPAWFAVVAFIFAAITGITTLSRIALAYRNFG